ncbi:hypothetical protein [Nocardia sp. NPDC005366]|uniref:hypothetical protein n=1 Tax=Nocardia sp. NPDC005366 TaxID=3156878 RepID=UPI0033B1D73B
MDLRAELHRVERLTDANERLRRLIALLGEIDKAQSDVMTARDCAIRDLRASGIRVVDLVHLTGLTRARVNQILADTR